MKFACFFLAHPVVWMPFGLVAADFAPQVVQVAVAGLVGLDLAVPRVVAPDAAFGLAVADLVELDLAVPKVVPAVASFPVLVVVDAAVLPAQFRFPSI